MKRCSLPGKEIAKRKYKRIKQKREQRKMRAVYQMMSGEVRENGDRASIMVKSKEGVEVIKKAGHLKKVLSKYCAVWMSKGYQRWFLKWQGDIEFKGDGPERHTFEKVSGREAREIRTHPLFRDCAGGFALRLRLTKGMLESQKELLRESIPERAQYILTWYEKKYNKLLQRPLTEKDYELREVGMQISEERWLEYWVKAGPNKAADAAGSHNNRNLFKSLKKMVRCEATGEC